MSNQARETMLATMKKIQNGKIVQGLNIFYFLKKKNKCIKFLNHFKDKIAEKNVIVH